MKLHSIGATMSAGTSLARAVLLGGALTVSLALAAPTAQASGDAQAEGGHGGAHDASHDFNWYYGILGESDEVDHPTLLWRTKGMPLPFAALLFNSGILFFILYRAGKGPLLDGLKKRRADILKGMDQAAKMKGEAEAQLAEYEERFAKIDADIERIKVEMRDAAQREREQILEEARARQARLEREAKVLVEQELKAAHEELLAATVTSAVHSAGDLLAAKTVDADHERLCEDYLKELGASLRVSPAVGTRGEA